MFRCASDFGLFGARLEAFGLIFARALSNQLKPFDLLSIYLPALGREGLIFDSCASKAAP